MTIIQPAIYGINLYHILPVVEYPSQYFSGVERRYSDRNRLVKNAVIDSTSVGTSWFEKMIQCLFRTPQETRWVNLWSLKTNQMNTWIILGFDMSCTELIFSTSEGIDYHRRSNVG